MDVVLGVVVVAVGLAVVVRRRPLVERLRRERWPFGNAYGLRLLNAVAASSWVLALWGMCAIGFGLFILAT